MKQGAYIIYYYIAKLYSVLYSYKVLYREAKVDIVHRNREKKKTTKLKQFYQS